MSKKQISSNAIAVTTVLLATVSMLSIVIFEGFTGFAVQGIVIVALFVFVVITMRRNRWFEKDPK